MCEYCEGGVYIWLGMLNDVSEAVDCDRERGCCKGGGGGGEKRLDTGLESLRSSPTETVI